MTTDCVAVYVTTATRAEAESIALTVVNEGLAACANILPAVKSIYRWQGAVEHAEECVVVLKTTVMGFESLQNRIKQLHSYQCPCIVALPIKAGDPDYLAWIAAQILK